MVDTNFPRILAIQAIIQNESGQFLLKVRGKEPDQGKWELVAGYLKPGERLVETVKRKLSEEVGIKNPQIIEFTGKYYDDPQRHAGNYCIPLVFHVQVDSNDVKTEDGIKWFSAGEIESLEMALDNKQSIKDYLQI